jgi:hypothetical protein
VAARSWRKICDRGSCGLWSLVKVSSGDVLQPDAAEVDQPIVLVEATCRPASSCISAFSSGYCRLLQLCHLVYLQILQEELKADGISSCLLGNDLFYQSSDLVACCKETSGSLSGCSSAFLFDQLPLAHKQNLAQANPSRDQLLTESHFPEPPFCCVPSGRSRSRRTTSK